MSKEHVYTSLMIQNSIATMRAWHEGVSALVAEVPVDFSGTTNHAEWLAKYHDAERRALDELCSKLDDLAGDALAKLDENSRPTVASPAMPRAPMRRMARQAIPVLMCGACGHREMSHFWNEGSFAVQIGADCGHRDEGDMSLTGCNCPGYENPTPVKPSSTEIDRAESAPPSEK